MAEPKTKKAITYTCCLCSKTIEASQSRTLVRDPNDAKGKKSGFAHDTCRKARTTQ